MGIISNMNVAKKQQVMVGLLIILMLCIAGCSPGLHSGHIYIHDPNHIEVVFDRPMSMELEQEGVKVKASSIKPGFMEDILKFILLSPRN